MGIVVSEDNHASHYYQLEYESIYYSIEEDNIIMASELNMMLNCFCDSERETTNNVVTLPFNKKAYQSVIEYIRQSSFA